MKFSHKKVVASFNHRKVINFYCYFLTARHDRPVGSFIDRKGRTYYQYHMLSMWENSHLVSFFLMVRDMNMKSKNGQSSPKQARYVLYPSGEEYRRNTYENIRQNWVVEDIADTRGNHWRSRSRERYERSENRTEIAHERTRRSTSRSRDRYERSDYTNEIGKERTKTRGGEETRRITLGGTKRKYDSSECKEERDRSYSTEEIPHKKGQSERSTQKEDNTKKHSRSHSPTPERKCTRQTIAVTKPRNHNRNLDRQQHEPTRNTKNNHKPNSGQKDYRNESHNCVALSPSSM